MSLFTMKDVTFQVADKVILNKVNLEIASGETVAIYGPSGSGKSTILKILASLIDPSSGDVTYEGINLQTIDPIQYRREVAYAYQTPTLFGKTVRENLVFPYTIRKEAFDEKRALELLETVNLQDSFLDASVNSLSGGEKQRVALIRSIIKLPKVLLLDEVTSALDVDSKKIIWDWLGKLKESADMTIIMVSHNPEEVALADKQIRVEAGHIKEIVCESEAVK